MTATTRAEPGTPSTPAAATRFQFSTTDPDEAHDFIERVYRARVQAGSRPGHGSPLSISQVGAGGISAVDVTMPPDLSYTLSETTDLSVSTLISGTTQAELGRTVERYQAGDVCLGAFPGGGYRVRCRDLHSTSIVVPAAAIAQVTAATPEPDETVRPISFGSLQPTSSAAAAEWRRVADFTRDVLADDQTAPNELILGSTARLLAATALAVFAHEPLLPAASLAERTTPAALRRAESYLHEHADTDVALADVAAAAHVSPRSLQYAFARHHQMTPMEYLRQVRLALAHDDLLAADPDRGDTVSAIALRWGFAHQGRFATHYRRTYGRPPSTTLRS